MQSSRASTEEWCPGYVGSCLSMFLMHWAQQQGSGYTDPDFLEVS